MTSSGRPKGIGKNTQVLADLNIGDSVLLPFKADKSAILQVARNRFYNSAKRLGIKLSFEAIDNNTVRIKREA